MSLLTCVTRSGNYLLPTPDTQEICVCQDCLVCIRISLLDGAHKQDLIDIFRWSIFRLNIFICNYFSLNMSCNATRCLAGEGGLPRWKVSRKRWNIFVNLEQQLGSFCKNGPQRFWLTTAHIKSAGGVRRSWKLLPFEWSVPSNSLGIFVSSFNQPAREAHGPKGPVRTEGARAVTGRWCPHSGRGEDFLMGQLIFLRKLL